jgi:hypothetical protein
MPLSTCCGAETDMEEVGICPDCLEHCDWEEEEEDKEEKEQDRQNEIALEQEQLNKQEN